VTAAAIAMIVIGVLVTILGLLIVLAGTFLSGVGGTNGFSGQFANIPAAIGGFVAVIGGIFVAFGVLEVFTGIYMLPGRPWSRILAIILSIIGGLVSLGGLFDGRGPNGGTILPLAFLVAYGFVIWVAIANGRWFARP
jgi:hypothetical protein